MARFDLQKYATVAERLEMLEKEYPDYRLETIDYSTPDDRAKGIWRVKTNLYLSREDQIEGLPKSTGHAFEIDAAHGPQATSGLEVCETSSVGRALALASAKWSGNKDDAARSLASREEMEKVQRGKPKLELVEAPQEFFDRVAKAKTETALRKLWDEAVAGGFSTFVMDAVRDRKVEITSD